MITTFLRSSMPSLKMQMSDSPPCSPSPPSPSSSPHPLLISPLWFIHFQCWRARRDNAVFHNWGCVPTTSTLKSPRVPHPPGRSDVTRSRRTGSASEGKHRTSHSVGSNRQQLPVFNTLWKYLSSETLSGGKKKQSDEAGIVLINWQQ